MKTVVDYSYVIARQAPIKQPENAITAVQQAYNAVAEAFAAGGREPAMVQVTVWAKPL